jgi:hypothetical protein
LALAGLGGLGVGAGCAQVAGLNDIQIAGTGAGVTTSTSAGGGMTATGGGPTGGSTTSTGGDMTASSSGSSGTLGTGMPCTGDASCISGHCAQSVCCTAACTGACSSCALPGLAGTCTTVPNGVATAQCTNGSACIQGACQPNMELAVGAVCSATSAPCINGLCVAGYCKLAVNDPCSHDIECSTGWCSQNRCKKCTANTQCASAKCTTTTGDCLLAEGAFCAANADCAGASCSGGICRATKANGVACTSDYDCQSYLCSTTCKACTGTTQCLSCTAGVCKAPSGASCHANTQCNSGHCIGTAPYQTCQ